jgi:hypothetical protein
MKIKEEKKDKIEIVKQTQAESQRILVGRVRPKRNHTIFEFNVAEKTVKIASFKVDKVINFENVAKGNVSQNKEIDGKEGCIYIPALNEKNAWKKFEKYLREE